MSVAERVKAIREARRDSIREAERRTGIGRGILFRIEQGDTPRSLETHLRQFARGYEVDEEELLDGQTPRSMFTWHIRRLHVGERWILIQAPIHVRVKLFLDFIRTHFPSQYDIRRIAPASGLPIHEVEAAIKQWRARQPDLRTAMCVGDGLHLLLSVSRSWLYTGWFDDEAGLWDRAKCLVNRMAVTAQKAPSSVQGVNTKQLLAAVAQFLRD